MIGADFGRPTRGSLDIGLSAEDRPISAQSHSNKTQSAKPRKEAERTSRERKNPRSRKPGRRSGGGGGIFGFFRRTIYWSFVLGLWAVIAAGGVVGYYTAKLPNSASWKVPDRPPNVRIVAVDGSLIGNRGVTGGEAVPLNEMSVYLPQAIIAIEDHRFYNHFGFDVIGFGRAMATNLLRGRLAQGGSSLSQQLAKNLFLEPERTVERKVQELVLALWLETKFTKDQIVEMYLNRVYFGANAYGVEAASQRYFRKSARDISLGEAATLAGLVKAPSRLAPSTNPEGARARAELVLAAMQREGYITEKQRMRAMTEASEKVPPRKTGAQNYIADWVMDILPEFVGEVKEDIVVETTIDRHLQEFAQSAIARGLKENGVKLGVSQGALVSIDGIGGVRAMVGGGDYGASQFNRVIRANRQPGSSFKPFVYLAALEAGLTPDTVRDDSPITIKGWTPQNYSRKFEGPVKLRAALARSLNTVAVKLADEVGPQYVVEVANRLGIDAKLTPNPSIALGTSEVTPFELATAYVPFANGGFKVSPFVIERVTTKGGNVLYQRQAPASYSRVIDPTHVGMMNAMLSETLVHGTGKRATLKNWAAGGKTGTSQDFRDAWFAGFTANLTTVVWLGNDDNSPTKKASGGSLPAQIWKDFMEEAHQGVPVANLPGEYNGTVFAGNLPESIETVRAKQAGKGAPQVVQANDNRGIRGFLDKLFSRE